MTISLLLIDVIWLEQLIRLRDTGREANLPR
jgi:hypothetical protein